MRYTLLTLHLFFSLTILAEDIPGGIKPASTDKMLDLHPSNFAAFLPGFKPDMAVFVFKQPKYFQKDLDSSVVFTINGGNISSYRKRRGDFISDPVLNKQLVEKLIGIQDLAFFRLYYKNAAGEIYKYQDLNFKGKKFREAVLTDAATSSLEIQKFYETGIVSNRTQYIVGKLDSIEKRTNSFDTLWFGLKPKLLKSGKEEAYYGNQNLLLARVYDNGVVRDSVYHELYSNGTIRKIYTTKNGLLDGPARSFDKEGKLQEDILFEKGKIVKTVLANRNFDNRKKAFLFGIDKFNVPSGVTTKFKTMGWASEWMDLGGCANDIDSLKKVLTLRNGFDPVNVVTVTDNAATRSRALAAFKNFSLSLNKGDVVFLHFSGHGNLVMDMPDSLRKYEGLVLPCRDVNYPPDSALSNSNYIFQFQLEDFFNSIKKRVGKTGQLIISLDVSHSGQLLAYGDVDTLKTGQVSIAKRGESNNMLFNLVKDETAPVIIYTGTSSQEFGFEMRAGNKSYGAYSLALINSLNSPWSVNSAELHEEVIAFFKLNGMKQTPGYLANETQFLFEGKDATADEGLGLVTLPVIKPSGNVFLLSVGISDYVAKSNEKLSFKNCEMDARAYAGFFEKQFHEIAAEKDKKKLYASLLINKEATKEKILAAINNAISNSKPDDYFIFNFSGYCKPLKDSSGKQVTWFVPYGLKSISDSNEIRKNGISLTQLKDLLQMIPANNQLFITEAGSTDDFQKEFIQALIETSPTIASLSNKNRVFIVPNGSGLDNFMCKGAGQEHGPINYFVTNLSEDLNVYGLFEGGIYADAVKFNLNKTAVDCDYFRTGYFDIFFERDFIKSLRYFLPEDVMKSRGAKLRNDDKQAVASTIAKKYALVVGTNIYSGKPTWNDLDGVPELDAQDIAKELDSNFGFHVKLLLDKPADSIYENILLLSRILQPNDQLMIYVAGHGDYDDKLFDDGFIVCTNSKQVKDDPYRNTYIQYSKLSRMINKLPARQIMMVLDVCFGGTFDERVARNKARSKNDYEDMSTQNYMAEKLKLKTRLYLTSGGKKEVPNGYRGSHSPFAQRFLQCLQTKGGTGKLLTASDFFQFVKMLPSGPLVGSFGDDDYGSEFVMLAK
ncbi:MAG TPA: caspase family protein [Chitinophagaceae bacterium]|nr:caspase family protein [Chitinophagaceae bacterium]